MWEFKFLIRTIWKKDIIYSGKSWSLCLLYRSTENFLCNVQKEEKLDPFYRSIRNYFLLYFRYNDRSSANKNNPILTKLYTGYFCVSEVISIYFGENWLRFGYIHPFHIHEIWRLQISTLKFIFSYEYLPYVHPQSTVKKTVSLKI